MNQLNEQEINLNELRRKAKGGSLLSAFELYQLGKNKSIKTNLSDEEINFWHEYCWNYLQKSSGNITKIDRPENMFCIKSLILVNFRRFLELTVKFEHDLTVIIGNNGQGKTSILDALTKSLSWFVSNLLKEGNNGLRISEDSDINNDSGAMFSDIFSTFYFGEGLKNINIRLSRAAFGAANRRESIIKPAKQVADIWRVINNDKIVNLPIFAFYSVERSHSHIKSKTKINEIRVNRFDAYNDALTGAGRFDHFAEWFIYLHKKTDSLETKIELLKKKIQGLEQSSSDDLLSAEIVLNALQIQLQQAQNNKIKYNSDMVLSEIDIMHIISKLICKVVPSITRIWVETSSGRDVIKVVNDGQEVRIGQISDGQRVLLALVTDLARRMIMLNPLSKNPLTGRGIVLIDEIELHIHPQWQQLIICNLRSAFPNIQFILTTHSPIVLSTVEKRCIRILNPINEANETLLQPPIMQTKGSESSDILEQVMKVLSTPQNIDESHWLTEFEEMIINQNGELNEDTQKFYEKIVSHFGEESSEHKQADSLIRLNRIKNKISKYKQNKDL